MTTPSRFFVMLAFVLCPILSACSGESSPEKAATAERQQEKSQTSTAEEKQAIPQTSAAAVKHNLRQLLDSLKVYSFEQKEVYQQALEKKLQDLDTQIDRLQEKAAASKTATEAQLREQIALLKEKREAVHNKSQEIGSASAAAWEDMKAGIAAATEDLVQAYDKTRSRFQ